jgi:hypothetical protein
MNIRITRMRIKKGFDYGPNFLYASRFYVAHGICHLFAGPSDAGWNDGLLVVSDG